MILYNRYNPNDPNWISENYVFDLWKRAELGFLERKIFSMFRKLQECFVKLLKIVTVLYVGKMSTTFKKRKKKYFMKNGSPRDFRV